LHQDNELKVARASKDTTITELNELKLLLHKEQEEVKQLNNKMVSLTQQIQNPNAHQHTTPANFYSQPLPSPNSTKSHGFPSSQRMQPQEPPIRKRYVPITNMHNTNNKKPKNQTHSQTISCCVMPACGLMLTCATCKQCFHASCLPDHMINTDVFICDNCLT